MKHIYKWQNIWPNICDSLRSWLRKCWRFSWTSSSCLSSIYSIHIRIALWSIAVDRNHVFQWYLHHIIYNWRHWVVSQSAAEFHLECGWRKMTAAVGCSPWGARRIAGGVARAPGPAYWPPLCRTAHKTPSVTPKWRHLGFILTIVSFSMYLFDITVAEVVFRWR